MSNPAVRKIGTVTSVHGIPHEIGVDHDAVTVGGAAFDAAARAEFMRLWAQADAAAKAWAQGEGEAGE